MADGKVDSTPVVCPGHTRPVSDVAYSNMTEDGYFLISSCLDGKPMLRDGATGDWIGTFNGHKGAAHSARLNDACTQAVTASGDFSAKLWDAMSGDELLTLEHKHIVKACSFSKDGAWVYTGGHEKKLRLYDLAKPEAGPLVFESAANISFLALTADANLLLSGGSEKGVRMWDVRTGKTVHTLATNSDVTSLTRSLDGRVVSVAAGRDVYFYDCGLGGAAPASAAAAPVGGLTLMKTAKLPRELSAVAFHAGKGGAGAGRFVTGSSTELWVRLYDFDTANELACNKGHHGPVRCVAFDPFGTHYASGSEDGTIRIFPMPGVASAQSSSAAPATAEKSGPAAAANTAAATSTTTAAAATAGKPTPAATAAPTAAPATK